MSATPVEAFELDGPMVRACCESDPALGYELTRRLARVVAKRLRATRVRLITASGQTAGAFSPRRCSAALRPDGLVMLEDLRFDASTTKVPFPRFFRPWLAGPPPSDTEPEEGDLSQAGGYGDV